jgi:PAS domain S-box-containing protein
MESLKEALRKQKEAKKEAELTTAEKSLELSSSSQKLQEMDKRLVLAESIAAELEQLIKTANAPIFGIDHKGLINKWNKASEKITGFKKEEVIGKNLVLSYIHKEHQKGVKQLLDDALLGIETANYHLRLFSKDGELKIISFNSSRRLDFQGKTIGVLAIGADITELTFQNSEKGKRANELDLANKEIDFQSEEKEKRADELILANKELAFQNDEKEKRAQELVLANKELTYQNEEKDKRANELILANEEKEKKANELAIANIELDFQNEEKEKRADELFLANKELAFQNNEKGKRADELVLANKELTFQNEEKEKRANELVLANIELDFQNNEKGKRADELALANKELTFQNEEKEKRANELAIANIELDFQNEEKEKRANELALANKELIFQNNEKDKRANELSLANEEKEKRANELAIANIELDFQNEEKEKRANELVLANIELDFQNKEKNKRVNELTLANEEKDKRANELAIANEEKEKRANELTIANKELAYQNEEKEKRADELVLAKKELAYQKELDGYRSEMERVALDLTRLIKTANAPIFGIDKEGLVNEWNQTSEKITGFTKEEVLGKDLVETYITEDYQKAVKQVLVDALLGKETANYEFPLFAKNGARVMVLLNSSTRRDANGKITGVLGVGQDITELANNRTQTESIAKELRQFIETANAPIFGIDSHGLVNEWNQTSQKITGFTKNEVLGKDLVKTYITEDYQEAVKKVLDDALLGKETANYEFPLFAKDGKRVMVLLNSSTRRDANGKITGVLGVGQDITQIDKLRTASESIAKELRQFIETANAPIFGIDSQGLVNEWNQTSEAITGFSKEEVLGKDLVQTYITEDYQEAVKKVLDDALLGKETANYEFPLFAKDGKRVMVLLNSSTRRDTNGNITGVLGVGQDITELANNRTQTESIAKELRQFIETANAPIFGIDSQGLVNEWNQTSQEITGFTKDEVLGKDLVKNYITEDYQEAVKKVLDDALLGKETANYEFPLFAKNGKRVMVLLNSSTRRDANGKITGVLGVGQDITQIDKLRTTSEFIAKELRQFIETANAPIFGIDSQGLVNEWNQSSEAITGFTKKEVLGKDLVKTYITEDYQEAVKKVLDDALLGKETANYEFPLFAKNGARVMVLLNSSTRRDTDGNITGVLGVGQNITELAKNRAQTEYVAKELRQFIETANAPIFGIDSQGLVNEWNQTSEAITGFSKEEVLGKDLVQTYITEDYQEAVKKVLDDALLGKETANYEFPLFAKDGKRVMVLLNSSTRRDTNGNITGVLGVGQDITELANNRTQTESIAKELRQFIETANAPIFGIDSHGLVNEWNQTSQEITGFTKDEVLGKDLVKTYITEDYQEAVKKVLDDALLGKETANYEFPLFAKDGKRVAVLLNSSTRRDANGKITGVLGVGQDITQIDKLRTASESIAKELRQFIETANAPIFGIDSQGLVNEWNQTSAAITGFTKNEVLGKDLVKTYITEDYQEAVKKVLDDALLGKETANYEFPLFAKDGKRVMVLLNSSTRRDANGKITGVLGVGQDITQIDKLRTASESIAKELRQFIETANAPIFGIDSQGLVNEWNQTSEAITGFTKDEVLGKDLVKTYITEDYQEAVKKVLDNALLGEETANFEFPLFTKEKNRVMVLLNSSTRRNANGEVTGVLGVGQDITELVGYRKELEFKVNQRTLKLNEALKKEKELSELKSKFVSTASHEFRTPLSAINFAAGSIKKYWSKMDPGVIDNKLHKIEDQVKHMTKLLDDILIVGQAEAGKMTYNPVHLNLKDFIFEIIEEVSNSDNKVHKILLIDSEELENTTIFIDEKLGRNIFINIINNAVKFSPDSDKVTIELSSERDFNVISVTDFGIGIPEPELKNIFKPFTRGENVDLIQGTGLGLSIVKEAIDLLKGELVVTSTIGKGTTFIVKIAKISK